MRQQFNMGGCIGIVAIAALVAQPAWAAPTQVTEIRLNRTGDGISVTLLTASGDRPQIFTVSRGNDLIADITNAQLRLPSGSNFSQSNPDPEISSIIVYQLQENTVRLVVTGTNQAPTSEILQRDPQRIVLGITPGSATRSATGNDTADMPPGIPANPTPAPAPPVAQIPSPQDEEVVQAPAQPPQQVAQQQPDVLVPNPEITINGQPAVPPGTPRINPAPPFLPRAVAPPLGDIAVSSVDTSPSSVDLGTAEVVPRLVLRDAPVGEVLALLARAADLNLVYVAGGGAEGEQTTAAALEQTVSLDIQNEPVQDVFNSILRLTGLQVNRVGRTIFVGARLPDAARDVINRTLRLNQIDVLRARDFLVEQGAERNEVQTATQVVTLGEGATTERITSTATTVVLVAPETANNPYKGLAPLPLRGLLVAADQRTNAITLIGEPRKVEIAEAFLQQLDLRVRQVAINVKVIDINLLNTEDFNTSFSFGVGDTFIVSDGGAAIANFGGGNPPNAATTTGSPITPPVITNPVEGTPFFDPNSSISVPGTIPDIVVVSPTGQITRFPSPPGQVFTPITITDDPLTPGITDFTLATDTVITQNADGTATVAPGTLGDVTVALTDLFQFPTRFLATLQAQIVSGNAKILTDPTLVVQEGQQAAVRLTDQVVQQVELEFTDTASGTRESRRVQFANVGLELDIAVSRIDDNGFVTLSVNPTVSSPTTQIDLGDGQFATTIQRRQVQSGQIRLRDGQTLILSGIIQDSDRTTVSKWPILGDLPIIGALFRSTNRQNQRLEVIVLLTPQILDDSDRATFGYSYTPSREATQVLQQGGATTPGRR